MSTGKNDADDGTTTHMASIGVEFQSFSDSCTVDLEGLVEKANFKWRSTLYLLLRI